MSDKENLLRASIEKLTAEKRRRIEEKIAKDRVAWAKKADALQATAVKAIAATRAHDKEAVLAVGSEIDEACESCHKVYWYPDEKIPAVR